MEHVIIVGGGRVGSTLAALAIEAGSDVRVVEQDGRRVAELGERFGDAVVVAGSGASPEVLEEAGIHVCDVLAAVSDADEANLAAMALAKSTFGVPRTVGRVNDPRNAWLFHRDLGVDTAIDQADLLAHLIAEEMSLGDMHILVKLRRGSYSLVEERVGPDAPVVGVPIRDISFPPRCVVLAVVRGGEVIPAHGDLTLHDGDDALALVHVESARDLADLLT